MKIPVFSIFEKKESNQTNKTIKPKHVSFFYMLEKERIFDIDLQT